MYPPTPARKIQMAESAKNTDNATNDPVSSEAFKNAFVATPANMAEA